MKKNHLNKKDHDYKSFRQWCDWGAEIDLKVYDHGGWVSLEAFMSERSL